MKKFALSYIIIFLLAGVLLFPGKLMAQALTGYSYLFNDNSNNSFDSYNSYNSYDLYNNNWEFIETEDEHIAKSIRKHGWHAISVDASEYTPRFIYTIGLMETYDHPEVIVFGFDPQFAHTLLCNLVDDVKNGKTYAEEGIYEGLLEGFPIAIRHIHPTQFLIHK